MQVWNQSQIWFKQTYFASGQVYFLVSADKKAEITVRFIGVNVHGNYAGLTNFTSWKNNQIMGVLITIAGITTSIPNTDEEEAIRSVTLHEFGHALGLGHAPLPADIMSLYANAESPSTLDLYAVHVLAEGSTPPSATLPTQIPYMIPPDSALALPEFGEVACLLPVLLLSSLLIVRDQRKGQYAHNPKR